MSKHARNQYQDQTHPEHNVTEQQVLSAAALLESKPQGNPPYWGIAEFNDQNPAPGFQVNIPANTEPPPEVGTRRIEELTRLMSAGFTDQHGHAMKGAPVSVVFTIDNGTTWQFVSDYLAANLAAQAEAN